MNELMNINDLMILVQPPVIEEHLKKISDEIDEKVSLADSLVCTEETLKEVEATRAALKKDFAKIEEERKRIKNAIMEPYNVFDGVYKKYVTEKYNSADAILKAKIGAVRKEINDRKMSEVREYFDEYAAAQGVTEYADFERQMDGLRPSYSMKEFQRISREKIDILVSGLQAIDKQPEELRAEILVEFKRTLKASEAIVIVAERKRAIEEAERTAAEHEKRKLKEAEVVKRVESAAAPLPPPETKQATPEQYTVAFKVSGTKDEISALVGFMRTNGIEFTQIPMRNIITEEAKSA